MASDRGRIVFYFLCYLTYLHAFNLDTKVPIIKNGRAESYFGYSVAQHIKTVSGKQQPVILVGAPKDNITDFRFNQRYRDLKSPGYIYSCPMSTNRGDCDPVDPSLLDLETTDWDSKDLNNMWLGVSVNSAGTPGGEAVACTHRLRNLVKTGSEISNEYVNGKCYKLNNILRQQSQPVEPCANRDGSRNIEGYGYCQSGMSSQLTKDNILLMGSPGPKVWIGMVSASREATIMDDGSFVRDMEAHSQVDEKIEGEGDADAPDKPPVGIYSYLGWSVASGNVGAAGRFTIISGAPRSDSNGLVVLLYVTSSRNHLAEEGKLRGDMYGSFYGYSAAVLDFNNDGKDDLVVSAPFYRAEGIGGAIYVYKNTGNGVLDAEPVKITSRKMPSSECQLLNCEEARFGHALANGGDIDLDGFDDLLVGAPYEGNGAVYLFRGSSEGLQTEYSQRITAKDDLPSAGAMQTFGHSLSGGIDMDDNSYPDVLVGAYNSNKVVVLLSRPVINIISQISSKPKEITFTKNARCPQDGTDQVCFTVRVCLKYTAKPSNKFTTRLVVNYKLEADADKKKGSRRVHFKNKQDVLEKDMTLKEPLADEFTCREGDNLLFVSKDPQDFLSPVVMKLTVSLKPVIPPIEDPTTGLPRMNEYPIMNSQTATKQLEIRFTNQCGDDRRCQSDLDLEASFLNIERGPDGTLEFEIKDEQEMLELEITVTNKQEEAHATELNIKLPENLIYSDTDDEGQKYHCVYAESQVNCSLGNPMIITQAKFKIYLATDQLKPQDKEVDVYVSVTTTSDEQTPNNDFKHLRLRVLIKTDIQVLPQTKPEAGVIYGGKERGENAIRYEYEIGPEVEHFYTIYNQGPGQVANLTVMVEWPYEVQSRYPKGKHLLYLMEEPRIDRPGTCEIDPKRVNPLGIEPLPPVYEDNDVASNVNITDGPKYNVRNKRAAEREPKIPKPYFYTERGTGTKKRIVTLGCEEGTAKCFTFYCNIPFMTSQQRFVITIRARLWNTTFAQEFPELDYVLVHSNAKLIFDKSIIIDQENTANDEAKATTKAISIMKAPGIHQVPLWVIIVATCAGVVLLIIIVVLLWAFGFFKRERPEDMRHQGRVEKKKSYYDEDDAY